MPLFSVDIEKELAGEFWTNRYVVLATDLAQAVIEGGSIYGMERVIHQAHVLFTRYRTSDFDPGTDNYQITVLNEFGLRTTDDSLPLFCVIRIDFTAVGGGRPSRKYLRGPVKKTDAISGTLTSGAITFFETNYATPLANLNAYVDVDAQPISSGQVSPRVGMRQLRRGSRRVTTPVLG